MEATAIVLTPGETGLFDLSSFQLEELTRTLITLGAGKVAAKLPTK